MGFRKNGNNWRLDTPETIVVVNLQKSPWSEAYYINLGVLVKLLPDLPDHPRNRARLRIVDCHYCVRLDDLFDDKRPEGESFSPRQVMVRALLDFNAPKIDAAKRAIGLQVILRERMLPFLELCQTERGIETTVKEWSDPSYLMHWQLRDRLGLKTTMSNHAHIAQGRVDSIHTGDEANRWLLGPNFFCAVSC